MRIIGVGNALIDLIVKIEEDILNEKLNLKKGGMYLIDSEKYKIISDILSKYEKFFKSGGSVANTMYGLGALGIECAYVGKVGKNDFGKFFKEDMENKNVKCFLTYSEKIPTGQSIVLVTPDHERTFATYLGAAVELNCNDVKEDWFKDFDLLHLEGYLIHNKDLFEHITKSAKKNNLKISLDLSNFTVVEEYRDYLFNYIKDYVNILFANEQEAESLIKNESVKIIESFKDYCECIVLKMAEKGSMIYYKGHIHRQHAFKAKVVDTTGAGDWYAAGFLYGLSLNYPINKCALIGTIFATKVIEVYGAKIPDNELELIKKNFLKNSLMLDNWLKSLEIDENLL